MKQKKYIQVFSVIVQHSYFTNNETPFLSFQPTLSTQEVMKRFGILMRVGQNGLKLYADSNNSIDSLLDYILQETEIDSFDFEIVSRDALFMNYTKLPINFLGKLVYSSNDELNEINNDTIILQPRLKDDQNDSVLGLINIQFEDLKKTLNENSEINYEILFDARSTHWQYYIINKSLVSLDKIVITGETDISFSEPVEVTIPNGGTAMLLECEVLIPLSQTPKYTFELAVTENDREIPSIKLPVPTPNKIDVTERNGAFRITSPMYIYI